MTQKIIQIIKTPLLLLSLVVVFAGVAPQVVSAQSTSDICQGANLSLSSGGNDSCDERGSTKGLNRLITQIVNIFSVIVGIIAVIMIILGGLKYITSGGDSNRIGSAKNTILYAIVGLIIVALAQFIVKFILAKATDLR